MHEKVEELIQKAKTTVNGKTYYDATVVADINRMGVSLKFSDNGVRYVINK